MTHQDQAAGSALTRRAVLAGSAALGLAAPARAATRQPVLKVALPSNLETIDPHQFRSILSGSAIACACETLLTHDVETMAFKPLLATSWRNLDPNTWEFKLRQGVRFHNGEAFNADSVKFSIERIINSPLNTLGKTAWPPSFGQSVEIIDPYTVHIVTKVPDPLVPNRLAAESLSMAPPKGLADYREKFVADRIIGTGPYKFVSYAIGRGATFEVNPDYWGPPPATPRIEWLILPDNATRVAALQSGAADVIANLPIPLLDTVEAADGLRVYSVLGSIVHGILLNANQTPALKDVRVRQALNHAVDRAAILKNLYKDRGKLLNGVVASQVQYAIDPGAYAFDPDKAQALLRQAGFGDGLELTFWESTNRNELAVEASQAIVGYLEDVGVHVNLQLLEWGEFNARASRTQFKDALHYGFINGTWDPDYVMQRFLPTFPTFRYYTATGELEQELHAFGSAFAGEERGKLAATCQQAIHDQAPWLFLWQVNENFGMKQGVQGFRMRPDHLIVVRDAYVES